MLKGDKIHTFENGSKEKGFFCMKLAFFLQRERTVNEIDYDDFSVLWETRFEAAKTGSCHYRSECPIYHRTIKSETTQLKLF